MHPRVLRQLTDVIARPLLIIFKRSWQLAEVPEGWKGANVNPIFKKSKKEDLRNYRLISLAPVHGKVMEQITWKLLPNILRTRR